MSISKVAFSGIYWTGVLQLGSSVIGFFVSTILARLLLPEEFGLIGAISIYISLGFLLMNSGLSTSLIRTKDLKLVDLSTVFVFNLVGSVIIYVVAYLTAPLIASFYNQDILTPLVRVLSLTFVIQSFTIIHNVLLTKNMEFKRLAFISIPPILVGALVGISMALLGYGVWSLVFQTVSMEVTRSLLLLSTKIWKPSIKFNNVVFKKHFKFGSKLTLSGLLSTVFDNIYLILIGRYFPIAQVGFYQKANGLAILPTTIISNVADRVSFPLLSTIQENDQQLRELIKRILKLVVFVITPVLVCMAVLATPLFRFLFTEKWLPAVPYFQIIFISALLLPIHGFNLTVLKVKGHSDLFLKAEIFKKIIVVVTILLVFQYGIVGLLYGSVIASVLSLYVNIYYSSRVIDYSSIQQLQDLAPAIFLGLVVGFIVYISDILLGQLLEKDIFRLLLGTVVMVTLYTCIANSFRMDAMSDIKALIKSYWW